MKRVYLLRHAKSSWKDPGLADRERPLAPRGRRAAKAIAAYLSARRITPALVLCSPARRARQTLEHVVPGLGDAPEVRIEPGLYDDSERELLARLQEVPEDVPSVMLIGHNPAIERLALNLAAGGAQLADLAHKYPTGALATLEFRGSWRELNPEGARLIGFIKPRDLE